MVENAMFGDLIRFSKQIVSETKFSILIFNHQIFMLIP